METPPNSRHEKEDPMRRSLTTRAAVACIAAVAALAVSAPLANAARGHNHKVTCNEPPAGWISVTDDQGVSWLVPAGRAMLSAQREVCTQQSQTTLAPAPAPAVTGTTAAPTWQPVASPYPGWYFVTNDYGVTFLQQTP
jgi:hypothetical protein